MRYVPSSDVMTTAKYRLIAIDLDGTLLSPTSEVTTRTRQAVHRCLSAGLLVCFATGRNWTESRTVLDAVEHYATAVFAGGALVIDTRNEVMLHRTMMEPALAAEVCRVLEDAGHAVLALQAHEGSGVDYYITDEAPLNEETRHWLSVTEATVHHVPRLADFPHEHTIRVGIVASAEEVSAVEQELSGRFGRRLLCQALPVPDRDVVILEVFDAAVNKWEGVLHVARRHGIAPAEIIAIGDEINDVPMIRHAGLGVAMGNAREEVRAIADRIIPPNHEDGLAQFLEEIVEQHLVEPERSI